MDKKIKYDKLIRDKIPAIIKNSGKDCVTRVLSDMEYKEFLYRKLQEEVDEFLADDNISELADITEVILAILELKKSSPQEMETIRLKKLKERGGFKKKLLLKEVINN
ncbi:nucleoside triphosphate pyrophosphohydrolase [Spirochaeta isovalerica]|uniref:Putative house-cleaning noncanonical NTP pyrophosphatase (MazG superfamily) n=1 Tax=Spirochaeta isovalerica TaxID=150 RepID=A0A841R969_9SPIO|nr:nucleoside triphosphate pyrophosphohydrolase [Spirochaeta isovalerica]MBB6481864.1 putative house-cleaning noncanonical NTP pyrophosphatase (MazG superfamily) [Spirochaeta isovalerica]